MTTGLVAFRGRMQAGPGGWAIGSLGFALALGLRWWTGPVLAGLPFGFLFLAVMAAAVMAGWRVAAAVAAASLLAGWYWVLPPYGGGAVPWPQGPAALAVFTLLAAIQVLLIEALFRQMAQVARLLEHQRRLYSELQHRVANGIQSLASVLSVQAGQVQDADNVGDVLHDAVRRLRSVAAVHRRLHDPDLGGPRFAEALEALTRDILRAAGREDVAVQVTVAPMPLHTGTASSLAMIVAEATANSIKHAFSGRDAGLLTIALSKPGPGRLRLEVGDDGPGPGDAPLPDGTLGVMIMEGFAAQMGGTFRLDTGPSGGARVVIDAPLQA